MFLDVNLLPARFLDHPHYETHHRASNWVARITGKNAAQSEREFLARKGFSWNLQSVGSHDVLEIGGDYFTGKGHRLPRRTHWLVLDIADEVMVVVEFPTMATALKARREGKILEQFRRDRATQQAQADRAARMAAGYVIVEGEDGFVALRTAFGGDEDCLGTTFTTEAEAREVFEHSIYFQDILVFEDTFEGMTGRADLPAASSTP